MNNISNPYYTFSCDPDQGKFSVRAADSHLHIENAGLAIHYRTNGRAKVLLASGWRPVRQETRWVDSALGRMQEMVFEAAPDATGIKAFVTFALPEETPLFVWKLAVENCGGRPVWLRRFELLRLRQAVTSMLNDLLVCVGDEAPAFYSQGWQSWSYSAVYGREQGQRMTRLPGIQTPLYANPGTPQYRRPGYYASDFFGILGDRKLRRACLMGFLAQRCQFGTLEAILPAGGAQLTLWANGDDTRLDPGMRMETDWAVLFPFGVDDPDPLGPYLSAVAREHGVAVRRETPSGWCSWYHFYQNLRQEDIRTNLEAIRRMQPQLPLQLVQIDDGFEHQVGDWFSFAPGFPHGVAPLAEEIRTAGLTPGLWLAPFIVHPGSQLAREHPDYLLKGAAGRAVNAGFIWNVFTHALDLTHPGALDYAARSVSTAAHEWGFPYLKLDFLYAGALKGKRRDETRTRAQIYRQGLQTLREAAGMDTFLLGCGAPLGASIGFFEAMRIGADVSGDWKPRYFGTELFFGDEPNMPSARNSVHNILTRSQLHHQWWINDPDCLLVREDTRLTLEEVRSLATAIGLTGGSLLVSDDMPALPPERLRIAQVLLPVIGKRARVIDWFDRITPRYLRLDLHGPVGEWSLLAYFNWEDHPQQVDLRPSDFHLGPGPYWARSFWHGVSRRLAEDQPFVSALAPHGVVLLAVRRQTAGLPQYLGSSLHLSQGLEVQHWEAQPRGIEMELACGQEMEGEVELYLPGPPAEFTIQPGTANLRLAGDSRYLLHLAIHGRARVRISIL
jgi:alpha-galactosidase